MRLPTLTDAERMQRAKGIRRYAIKLLLYYVALLPITLPLALLRWLGDRVEDAYEWIDRPAYRWRSEQEELQRELIRDNRKRKSNSEQPINTDTMYAE